MNEFADAKQIALLGVALAVILTFLLRPPQLKPLKPTAIFINGQAKQLVLVHGAGVGVISVQGQWHWRRL